MAVYPLICVVDTSIIIDLYRGEILAQFFKLPYVFVTADVILEELLEPEGKILIEFGLRIDGLEGSYVLEVFQLRTIHRKPSVNDLFAFMLAKSLNATLLTNDGSLRKVAQQYEIPVHGVLWILDEMVRLNILLKHQAVTALHLICDRGSHLPQDECDRRFSTWSSE
jgi:predicted nucleic acid-binding protein